MWFGEKFAYVMSAWVLEILFNYKKKQQQQIKTPIEWRLYTKKWHCAQYGPESKQIDLFTVSN